MWDTEMVTLLRYVIDDVDEPTKYADDRLRKLILVAAQFVQNENLFEQEYAISIDNETLRPDPTSFRNETREDAFINMTILKAACLLARGGMLKASKGSLVREGPIQYDNRGKAESRNVVVQTWCEAYKESQWDYQSNTRIPGIAIIGPYRAALDGLRGCTEPWR